MYIQHIIRHMDKNKKTVLVAMSGGVDSSVAALLLKSKGYDVTGATMELFNNPSCPKCPLNDAENTAERLGIPFYIFNFTDSFKKEVINYFIKEYLKGNTPNPCVVCNKEIKFKAFLDKAESMDMEYIATGHYAKVKYKNGRYLLKKAKDKTKDQTYVLYNLKQEQLSKIIFPLGNLTKKKVRKIAEDNNLDTANKPDSQEICFIQDNNYGKFIAENTKIEMKPGNIVDREGNILGKHNGIYHYTIGQRKGLKIPSNKPLYVVDIDIDKNEIVVGDNTETFSDRLTAKDLNWISIDKLNKGMKVKAKIRYGAKEAKAVIKPIENNIVEVIFNKAQRAVTRGQSIVFYKGNTVVGGGVIE